MRVLAGVVASAAVALAVVAASSARVLGGGAGATPLPSSACSKLIYQGPGGTPQFIIASDLPLRGAGRAQNMEMTKAIEFVLKQRGYRAGKYTVGYQSCDDSSARAAKWDSAKCASNAQQYARNSDVVDIIGTFNSGCTKLILPVLNRAPNGPVAMVSPANTYVGLTQTGPGTVAGEPGIYYPTGKRNYIRLAGRDNYQGAAQALLAKQLRVTKLYILNDRQTYGLGVASNVRNAAKRIGISVAGFSAWDGKASSYEALASKIKQSGANGVFLGGIICNNGGKLVKDIRSELGNAAHILAPDGSTPFLRSCRAEAARPRACTSRRRPAERGAGPRRQDSSPTSAPSSRGTPSGLRIRGPVGGRPARRDRALERDARLRGPQTLQHEGERRDPRLLQHQRERRHHARNRLRLPDQGSEGDVRGDDHTRAQLREGLASKDKANNWGRAVSSPSCR